MSIKRQPRVKLGPLLGLFLILMSFHVSVLGQYNLLFEKDGTAIDDKIGWSAAGVGDVNGDGVPDYIIGSPYCDPGGLASAGSAFVYSGSNGALLYQKNGTSSGQGLGYYVGGAGDVNGDGRADFIAANQTMAYIYSGANGALLYQKGSGGPVAGAGDVNGDGRADFMLSTGSQVYVYSGINGALLYQKTGGSAVAGIGDVNGDGKADFIIGDQYASPGITKAGSAYVYSGANGSLIYQKNGAGETDLLGGSVAGVGDVNGDGIPDFMVGARLADVGGLLNSGAAYVYSGATGALLYQKSGPASSQWGSAVSGAGDADGDGKADFMVSSIVASPGGLTSAGSVFLYSGATGALLQQFNGKYAYENLGVALAAVGDLNGNGRSEFLMSGPNASPGGIATAGSVYIYGSGGSSGPCNPDITPPALTCQPDKTIGCGQQVVFDQPTATDNCDAAPVISVVSTTQASGPGAGEITYTRTWTAADRSGNVSTPCSQDVIYSCNQTLPVRSQIALSSATCASFVANTSADLTQVCYSTRKTTISKCTPSTFYYFAAVNAPSTNFTVNIVQTRSDATIPYFGIARNGITIYDNCASIGSGVVSSPGQAQVTFNGATVGKQYVILVKYSASSLIGTNVGSVLPQAHYDFAAFINGAEVTRDSDGLNLLSCLQSSGAHAYFDGPYYGLKILSSPNPFNSSTQIRYFLPENGMVRIEIFNMLGQKVQTLVDDVESAGEHAVIWSGTDDSGHKVSSGIYFCRISTMDDVQVEKLNLLK